jgi:restriction endonuclease S subunit
MSKPKIRFKGFIEDWEQRKLSDCAGFRRGSFPQPYGNKDWYDGEGAMPFVQVADVSNDMKLVNDTKQKISKLAQPMSVFAEEGSVLVTLQGSIGRVAITQYGAFVDRTVLIFDKYEDGIDKRFWAYIIKEKFEDEARKAPGGTIKTITKEVLSEFDLMLPSYAEQRKLADYLISLDHLITLHQRKYEEMKKFKKCMLQKMFPQNGKNIPEIRFEGFTEDWEQRKFSELVTIERGGSPRPIDKFITNDENGLNWVKIGDAPEQGNYITQTAEKIRPEGLSKTREVHPGDLILSNSMSFGRPYIMAIDGCIHDGWLAIRDTKKNFDLKFLCTLLGTDGMLNQYKAMAAGSTVNNLNKELVGGTTVAFPMVEEQIKIGDYFTTIDHLITLHQRKYEELQKIKKFMLQNMFI